MHLPTFRIQVLCVAAMLVIGGHLGTAQDASGQGPAASGQGPAGPEVEVDTTEGKIIIELNAEKAPKTVANFLAYVKSGHYEGTVFHRVIPNFMIQCGGMDEDLKEKQTNPPVRNEAGNGLKNKKYTVAMARTDDPHSATCQFFISTADNDFLDRNEASGNAGYAVFGRVVQGLGVVDKIGNTKTHARPNPSLPAMLMSDVPVTPIVIKSVRLLSKTSGT